ncbi:MAG: BrnT family toxin [Dongiaceae bacterium]
MLVTWDPDKAASNRAKHGVSFETAVLVFDDPLHLSLPDPHPDGDRWNTIGRVGPVLLLVVHSWREGEREGNESACRMISARKATAHERRAYEEGSF